MEQEKAKVWVERAVSAECANDQSPEWWSIDHNKHAGLQAEKKTFFFTQGLTYTKLKEMGLSIEQWMGESSAIDMNLYSVDVSMPTSW